ncbi:OPT oligopeptide transporter [Truncatella angustata]|uniref:OPT oligopeptide transporter n=1 Tax=Truncatella angustata TaxID=152316 RepID=A0A9P8UWG3_9PEZI|nr:OPT oligopeptide transporter [Truncatella angustata]KAH6659271.1 OPT oligopeptide transporter [Truncatella angustata]
MALRYRGDAETIVSADNGSDDKNFADEKHTQTVVNEEGLNAFEQAIESELNVTEQDLIQAKAIAETYSLEAVTALVESVYRIHKHDPNFPQPILEKIAEFRGNPDIFENPEKHEDIIWEMKLEAALISNNSPYAEVRGVVENTDDPTTPCSTVRAWTIGIFFSIALAAINQLFSVRNPPITVTSNVAQLLAYPFGKAWEKTVPDWRFTLFGVQHSLNPGPFNKKEHMMIALMATVAQSLPYTNYIIWTQILPFQFNQQYARSFGYQILIGLSTNFIGYGLAGLTRKFLVYPAYCMWPASLVTIALNSALHKEHNIPVLGPFKKMYSSSRYRFFFYAFTAMFIYFWFPNFIFQVLTYFSWMTWIAPENHTLDVLTGFNSAGLFNPWPTFDWNVLAYTGVDPLMIPAFSTFNTVAGGFIFGLIIIAVYFTNTWNTGYIEIVDNHVWDHFGARYNVSRALDEHGMYDHEKYMDYSAAYLGSANTLVYGAFFGVYASALTYVIIFHRYEVAMGFKSLFASFRKKKPTTEGTAEVDGEYSDVHMKLMSKYPEVSEIWYLAVLLVAAAFGFAGILGWPTYTTAATVPYGVLLALIFVLPVGIIKAMTGIEVTLNVLAEFIGGMFAQGNALAMNYFKSFGYVTCAHAVGFANDLKMAHYLKIPPWHTFAAQMVGTLISTFVATAVMQYQINIENICTKAAPMRMTCPGPTTFFTASVLWGTIGPIKVFGPQGQYGPLLLGFPFGILAVLIFWGLVKKFPRSRWLRQVHPVAIWYGGLNWAPYGFSYMWPQVPVAWLSWIYIKPRYLAFWSKYNFVLSAAFSAGIAISAIIMFFTVGWYGVEIEWWGNTQASVGCEGGGCTLKTLADGERFYPWWNSWVGAP